MNCGTSKYTAVLVKIRPLLYCTPSSPLGRNSFRDKIFPIAIFSGGEGGGG